MPPNHWMYDKKRRSARRAAVWGPGEERRCVREAGAGTNWAGANVECRAGIRPPEIGAPHALAMNGTHPITAFGRRADPR